jgi:hypothetical protein
MKITEVSDFAGATPDPKQLLGLVDFLAGRATDTNSQKQISQDAFISIAQSLDIPINQRNIVDIVGQPPLSNVLEPLTPGSTDPIVFKGGNPEAPNPKMTVPQAQQVVAKMAKSAMKRPQ